MNHASRRYAIKLNSWWKKVVLSSLIFIIFSFAECYVSSGHCEAKELDAQQQDLKEAWKNLKEAAENRRTSLENALEAQQYLADANEAQSWMEVIKLLFIF